MTITNRIPRLALLTMAALTVLLVAKTGRDWKLHATQVCVLLATLALLRSGNVRSAARFAAPVAGWLLVSSSSSLNVWWHGSTTPTALDELLRQAGFLLVFLIAVSVFNPPDRRTLTRLWGVTMILVGGYALIQRAGLDWVEEFRKFNSASRPFATFGNPDFLGTHAAMLVPLFVSMAFAANRARSRTGWLIIAALGGLTLLFTQSRGAILGAGAGLAVVVVLTPLIRRRPGAHAGSSRTPLFVAGMVLLVAGGAFLSREMLTRRTDRPLLWLGTIRMIAARPLLGWGPGAFAGEFQAYAPPAFAERMRADNTFAEHPHSEYLHVAVESGLIGLGMFGWLLVAVLRPILRRARSGDGWSAGALGGLVAVLVHIAVDRNFRLASTAGPFWLLAGAAVTTRHESRPVSPSSPYRLFSLPVMMLLLMICAHSLTPLRASLKVESEVDFLKVASGMTSRELVSRKGELGGKSSYWVELGNTYARENNFPAAVDSFREALRIDPAIESAKNNLGNSYFMLSKFADAERVYRDLLVSSPDHRDARFNLAMALYYQRKIKDALLVVNEILQRDPVNAKAIALRQQLAP